MTRVAAIDIGTNSVLLLIAEANEAGALVPVVERATITRLGQGVDQTRELSREAIERTSRCLRAYASEIAGAGVSRAAAVGTSAMRDAKGAEEFRTEVSAILGFAPRVISGDEEARLTYRGSLSGLELSGPAVVFDIGGGSTEIIRGDATTGVIAEALSLDIGSVRLTERHVRSDPPTADQLRLADQDIARELDTAPSLDAGTLVGVAGTVTTIAAIARRIDPYDAARIHGLRLELAEIAEVGRTLASLPLASRMGLPGLSPKRADVIVAGARLCMRIVERSGAPAVVVSDRGVRWGLAEELVAAAKP